MQTQLEIKYLIITLILLFTLTACLGHTLGERVTPISPTVWATNDGIDVTITNTAVAPKITPLQVIVTQYYTYTPPIIAPTAIFTSQPAVTPILDRNLDTEWAEYRNDEYGIVFQHPVDWSVIELPNKIAFTYPGAAIFLRFKVKRADETINIHRTDMPAGHLIKREPVIFMGESLTTTLLVYEGKNKYVLYNNGGVFARGDLLFAIEMGNNRSIYEAGDIPEWMHEISDRIVTSVRWSD